MGAAKLSDCFFSGATKMTIPIDLLRDMTLGSSPCGFEEHSTRETFL